MSIQAGVVRLLTIAAALGVAGLLVLVGITAFVPRFAPPMLIVAHRGDVANWPENTLEGIVAAARLGAPGIEIDVLPSADGTWYAIKMHDVSTRTNGSGQFMTMRDEEILKLRITGGLGYRHGAHGDRLSVPRVEDVLRELAEYEGVLMFDVKSPLAEDHARFARIITESDHSADTRMICLTLEGAKAVKEVDPAMHTSVLSFVTSEPERYPAVDAWLANARTEIRWPFSVWVHPPGSVEAFVNETDLGEEGALLDSANRWDVSVFITNDLAAALEWQDGQWLP